MCLGPENIRVSNSWTKLGQSVILALNKLDKSGAIYNIKCEACPSQYIGETARPLRKRTAEHHRDSSLVGAHMSSKRHKFTDSNITVLDQDSRWFQRGIKEAIYIAAQRPDLNRDHGRHLLPPVYSSLIQSCRSGSNPVMHDWSFSQSLSHHSAEEDPWTRIESYCK